MFDDPEIVAGTYYLDSDDNVLSGLMEICNDIKRIMKNVPNRSGEE
jgi:hypothetical protein